MVAISVIGMCHKPFCGSQNPLMSAQQLWMMVTIYLLLHYLSHIRN